MNIIHNLFLNVPVILGIAGLMFILSIGIGVTTDKAKKRFVHYYGTKISDFLFVGSFTYIALCAFAGSIYFIINNWV